MSGLFRLALSILCIAMLMASAPARAGQNLLYYFSEPGDYIGQGAEVTFTATDGAFSLGTTFNNGVQVTFSSPGFPNRWNLNLAAPGGAVLQAGAYESAERWPFQSTGHPGLAFYGEGRGCNTLTGRFDVLELVRDTGGNITQFAANWEQHCEGLQPALFGQIRYNSDVPLSGKPIHINLENSLNAQLCVEATDPSGALVTVDALGITDAQGGTALSFAWSNSNRQTGSGPTFSFVEPLTNGATNPVMTTLTVTDQTNNTQKSVTKATCVSDTTPPSIVINKPLPGDTVRGDDIVLDVTIRDAVDKNISEYEIEVGRQFVSAIDPRTGRSKQHVITAPRPDGTITTTITVRAYDASGNYDEQFVTVTQIKK